MAIKPTYSAEEIQEIVVKMEEVEEGKKLHLDCLELKALRNLLTDLLRELDSFEFSTRLGYSVEDVCETLVLVKNEIDSICYADDSR